MLSKKAKKWLKSAKAKIKPAAAKAKRYVVSNHLSLINLTLVAHVIAKLNLIDQHLFKVYIDVLQGLGLNAMLVVGLITKLLGGEAA